MASTLDFEALLSREYRPARVTRLVPREAYHPEKVDKKKNKNNSNSKPANSEDEVQRLAEEATSRLVLSLVTHTSAFTKHIHSGTVRDGSDLLTKQPPPKIERLELLPAPFHQVELDDWEKKINWEGYQEKKENEGQQKERNVDPLALLHRPRNPYLDNISFDETAASWEGSREDLMEKARRAPLILELGVAGRSVARHVYQNAILSAQRPTPAVKSEVYQLRMERDWTQPVTSTADVTKGGSLHADKEKMEALIEARQLKRSEMAEDKTSRVIEAMGTLALGGGKGRTITSSLMGPGGTERTGRPSRHMSSSVSHDTEYIEQLDMVNSHAMVRDLSKLLLREYHRPKIPMNIVRQDLNWQVQIRYIPTRKKADAPGNSSSYQAIMSGTHAGAVSKAKLRAENDLSTAEGKLVLLEYSEERPPIQMIKGMGMKIVNFFRGDKARCPVSAGGGDRPARRKRAGEGAAGEDIVQSGKSGRPPRLDGPNRQTTLIDWIGKLPEKSQKDRAEKETIDILPEGITETLYHKVHGPFIGEVEEGTTVTGLITNLFVAPMFRQEPETTDFLMVLTPPGGVSRPGQRESMGVILRDLPSSIYTVGQTEPRTRVWAPNTQGEKNFVGPFVSYQIAKALARSQQREGHGLRFDELQDRVLPNLELPANALRQRLKQVALYDKNTMIWTTKAIGYEDYPGVDALAKSISPEGVAAFETACAAARHLSDVGIHQMYSGSHTVGSVAVTMVYIAGQLNAARELSRKTKKLGEISRTNKSMQPIQTVFYEKAAAELEAYFKMLRQKYEIAKFIYEELQLAPWHLTGEFIEVHKKAEGTGMMKLTGLGDPSGQGEGFSFLREVDAKPTKAVGTGTLSAQMKKITGTEDDLRKLTMKQMAALLRSYGMAQKQIDTLKRWDRVHVIRDLSTKAASDGIGDGLERFARGEKMKLSEQKQMYRDRIQVIWRRQITALSMEGVDRASNGGADGGIASAEGEGEAAANAQAALLKGTPDKEKDDSGSDSDYDDDDLAATLEEEMMDRSETNQLVAAHAREQEGDGGLGQLRAAAQDKDLSKDARELAALKRQREEERAAQEELQSAKPRKEMPMTSSVATNRKVIRKRITKTHPDGKQTTTFKFVLHPEEVGKILSRLQQQADDDRPRTRELTYEHGSDDKPPGHAIFEDEDDFEYSSRGRLHTHKRRGGSRRRGGSGGRGAPRARNLQLGKLKTKVSKEDRMKKRKREEEELEVYATSAKRKGTNNRRERGSIRDRRPHVIFAEKLEAIRSAIESRPYAGPFVKPVNSRLIPRYYEVISHPIDLQTIRDKISRYEYRSADAMVRDFELMKTNAIKFNGQASPITQEAIAIFDYVRDQIEASRDEFASLEVAVQEQMSGKPKKKKKQAGTKKSSAASGNVGMVGGVQVNLGDFKFEGMSMDGIDSDSDDSFTGLLDA
jgi:hypothetical protein